MRISRTGLWIKLQMMRNHWLDYPLGRGFSWAGRYEVEQLIGMGSYGQAYRCLDAKTGRTVLVKSNKPSKRELGLMLLRRESSTLKSLKHPQVPNWLDYTVQGNREALVMELVEGKSLEQLIHEQGRTYTADEALLVVKKLLAPLEHLHQAGFVHRDVRIPNVLEQEGNILLIDYGLSCRIGEYDLLQNGFREAAVENEDEESWAAVKKHMREPAPSSDFYGLGHLFLFLMYAGYEYAQGQIERSWEEELQLKPEVQRFVRKLLMSESEAYSSASACLKELNQLLK